MILSKTIPSYRVEKCKTSATGICNYTTVYASAYYFDSLVDTRCSDISIMGGSAFFTACREIYTLCLASDC